MIEFSTKSSKYPLEKTSIQLTSDYVVHRYKKSLRILCTEIRAIEK